MLLVLVVIVVLSPVVVVVVVDFKDTSNATQFFLLALWFPEIDMSRPQKPIVAHGSSLMDNHRSAPASACSLSISTSFASSSSLQSPPSLKSAFSSPAVLLAAELNAVAALFLPAPKSSSSALLPLHQSLNFTNDPKPKISLAPLFQHISLVRNEHSRANAEPQRYATAAAITTAGSIH